MKGSIILEGYDGAGKSTLANQLSKTLKMPVFHAGPKVSTDVEAMECCRDQMMEMTERRIMDRVTPISRLCYQVGLSDLHSYDLLEALIDMKRYSYVVWCKPTKYVHIPRQGEDLDHVRDIEARRASILMKYDRVMPAFADIVYDWEVHDHLWVIKNLICARNSQDWRL
jgi:hypothetical protein